MDNQTVVDAINELGDAIIGAARMLGNGDASTNLGAIEALGMAQERGMNRIAQAIETLAHAVQELKDERSR